MTAAVRRHDPAKRDFASDNNAGVHPEVLAAIALANGGHQSAYGDDDYTAQLQQVFARHFGEHATAYPVFSGTGANVVALQALLPRWGAVIAADTAHAYRDECGAPEKLAGVKFYPVPTPNGKLTPALIDEQSWALGNEHRAQPAAVLLTQSTELGTCYTPAEIRDICAHAHSLGMLVHVDGARLANAAATLGRPLREFTTDAGVDVVSFGGTKNGLMFGEAVVVLNPAKVRDIGYLRMMSTQLASKMRFISVQFEALLGGDLWLRNATHANTMALRLAAAVRMIDGVQLTRPVEANAVFATLPRAVSERVQKHYRFYLWNERTGEARWMCAFDTTAADVDDFAALLADEMRHR